MSVYEHSILLAILEAKRPLTAIEISHRTRTPTSTVYRVCAGSNRIETIEGRPAKFYAERHAELDANSILVKYQKPQEGWLTWTEDAKGLISQLLDIDKKSQNDRETRAQGLRGVGILLLSLAKDIEEGLDRPNWRERLDK